LPSTAIRPLAAPPGSYSKEDITAIRQEEITALAPPGGNHIAQIMSALDTAPRSL
jgi:hypothetical protein